METNTPSFEAVLDTISAAADVPYTTAMQHFWRSDPQFTRILMRVIDRRDTLGPSLSPKSNKLAIRASCPVPGCGRADKHGVLNDYSLHGEIGFLCGVHGRYVVRLDNEEEVRRLGFNTPLRNLIRILLCSLGDERGISWVMCTGSDYSGFYQEQFLWRVLEEPKRAPMIFYAPLVVDWSGVKLSKSLYVKEGAYGYIRQAGLEYAIDGEAFVTMKGGINALYEEVLSWFRQPFKLFRNVSCWKEV